MHIFYAKRYKPPIFQLLIPVQNTPFLQFSTEIVENTPEFDNVVISEYLPLAR